jgi:hypothetical protein
VADGHPDSDKARIPTHLSQNHKFLLLKAMLSGLQGSGTMTPSAWIAIPETGFPRSPFGFPQLVFVVFGL